LSAKVLKSGQNAFLHVMLIKQSYRIG